MNAPGKTRAKAVKTLAKKAGVTTKEAQRRQAIAIAISTAKAPPKKLNK